ncbi:GrpB family protein [Conexibacter stalactiti]|uniref:GrpB family protein n=1 Tax=Conexibacter stalactiti TaxID=1940611 RepID=A0ABU4HTL1_9ACTN|nr:GrpB family protein [Conexibacter stalactiti]MDW5596621.1 GrpB family protein [Conexibacter stalactiti]MEC5037263.1 GrpB family protein [Conexibacter stalactiti]
MERPERFELIGGRERREIVLLPHDPAWAARAEQLIAQVRAAFDGIAVRPAHVGSTAVPGLAAKPIVDLQAATTTPPGGEEARLTAALAPLGFELRVREPDHLMYRTPARDVHLHLWEAGSEHERRHLLFRDHLRADAADRERYAAVKRELAARDWDDMNDYAQAKDAVIAEITARAEAWAVASGWRAAP